MNNSAEVLFEYLREMFYNPSKAKLDLDKLDNDFVNIGKGLMYFAHSFAQYNDLAQALARGDLSASSPPPENELAAPLKSLHASLKHLTWQTQQVASGDYKQRVDFMGEFSDAFNIMTKQLADRQKKLEDEIENGNSKTVALEQSNQLLTNITQNIAQQIIVIDRNTRNILFMNNSAKSNIEADNGYLVKILDILPHHTEPDSKYSLELRYGQGDKERYLSISGYFLEWRNVNAEAVVISDISAEKTHIRELETFAYHDAMTELHNRLFGMTTLEHWIEERRRFAMVFADLDNLKYINDKYGHAEGDKYIISTAKFLKTFSTDAIVCRIGGDEFMLLAPNSSYEEAHARMEVIFNKLKNDDYLSDKDYYYSLSFGIVSINEFNTLSPSTILSLADERMYEQKQLRKKDRKRK